MNRYLTIWLVWGGVWGISQMLPQADGMNWFVIQALWSSLLSMAVLEIERTLLTCSIVFIELLVMFFQLFSYWGYKLPASGLAYFYNNYAYYQNCANIAEIIILLLCIPGGIVWIKSLSMEFLGQKWRGVYSRIRVLRGLITNRHTNSRRPV